MAHTNTTERIKIQVKTDLKEPAQFGVIYVNDEVTSFDFVIATLVTIFEYDPDGAEDMACTIHEQGQGMVAIFPYEIAEQKAFEVLSMAKLSGFPLVVRVEPVE